MVFNFVSCCNQYHDFRLALMLAFSESWLPRSGIVFDNVPEHGIFCVQLQIKSILLAGRWCCLPKENFCTMQLGKGLLCQSPSCYWDSVDFLEQMPLILLYAFGQFPESLNCCFWQLGLVSLLFLERICHAPYLAISEFLLICKLIFDKNANAM